MKKRIGWAALNLVWDARGYNQKEISDRLMKEFPGTRGFALSSVQRKVQERCIAPVEVAEFILDLRNFPIRKGYEEAANVVQMGLAALESGAVNDPNKVAASMMANAPMLDPEVIARAVWSVKFSSPMFKALRKLAGGLRGKLDAIEAKLDTADARREAIRQELLKALLTVKTGLTLALLTVGTLGAWRLATRSAPEVARAPERSSSLPVIYYVNAAQGGAVMVFDLQTLLGAIQTGQMGSKTPEGNWIPSGPLPGQKLPPCDASAGEAEINGGCWAGPFKNMKPPCGRLFRGGEKGEECYRPVAADPTKPVTDPMPQLSQEVH